MKMLLPSLVDGWPSCCSSQERSREEGPTAGDWGIKVEQIQPLSQAHEPCQDSHACVNHTPFHLSTGSGLPPALLGEFFQETL